MRMSDWISDVCSSDLPVDGLLIGAADPSGVPRGEIGEIVAGLFDHANNPFGRVGIVIGDVAQNLEIIVAAFVRPDNARSEEHTSELQSLMRISYAVFCLKKKKKTNMTTHTLKIHYATHITKE